MARTLESWDSSDSLDLLDSFNSFDSFMVPYSNIMGEVVIADSSLQTLGMEIYFIKFITYIIYQIII